MMSRPTDRFEGPVCRSLVAAILLAGLMASSPGRAFAHDHGADPTTTADDGSGDSGATDQTAQDTSGDQSAPQDASAPAGGDQTTAQDAAPSDQTSSGPIVIYPIDVAGVQSDGPVSDLGQQVAQSKIEGMNLDTSLNVAGTTVNVPVDLGGSTQAAAPQDGGQAAPSDTTTAQGAPADGSSSTDQAAPADGSGGSADQSTSSDQQAAPADGGGSGGVQQQSNAPADSSSSNQSQAADPAPSSSGSDLSLSAAPVSGGVQSASAPQAAPSGKASGKSSAKNAGNGSTIDGGTVNNGTNIGIKGGGGTAIGDAGGGGNNLAANSGKGGNAKPQRGLAGLANRWWHRTAPGSTAAAGNGGRANASADGGIVVIGSINSGGNKGNTINVGAADGSGGSGGNGGGGGGGCISGPLNINGGTVNNTSNINIDASGGTAIGDASGGSNNGAILGGGGGNGNGVASSGNGGLANASANGGIVVIHDINTGNNQGNTINVSGVCSAPAPAPVKPVGPAPAAPKPSAPKMAAPQPAKIRTVGGPTGKAVRVNAVPKTGVGPVVVADETGAASLLLGGIALLPLAAFGLRRRSAAQAAARR